MKKIFGLRHDRHVRQFVKFGLVGGLTTIINFAIYVPLVLEGFPYIAAAIIAFAIATLNSYTWNRIWTFRAGRANRRQLSKFFVVQTIGLTINVVVLAFLVEALDMGDHKLIAQLISNAFVVLSNFAGNKFWTFR